MAKPKKIAANPRTTSPESCPSASIAIAAVTTAVPAIALWIAPQRFTATFYQRARQNAYFQLIQYQKRQPSLGSGRGWDRTSDPSRVNSARQSWPIAA